jgi:hypothetical protein
MGELNQEDAYDPGAEFRDDLIAANRFKAFLIATGTEVPERVIAGLARLTSDYLPPAGDTSIGVAASDDRS